MTVTYPAPVLRGGALLDQELGTGWPLLVNTERLRQPDPTSCVAGQIAQSVGATWWDMVGAIAGGRDVHYGFSASHTSAWKRLIIARQVEIIRKIDGLKTKRSKKAYVQTLVHPSIRKGAK